VLTFAPMQTTITLTHPSKSHTVDVEVNYSEKIDVEPPYFRTVYIKSWQAEKDWDEDGFTIPTDWITEDLILNQI